MVAWLVARKVTLGLVLLVLVSGTGGVLLFGLGTGRPPPDALLVAAPSPLATLTSGPRSRPSVSAPTAPPPAHELKVYISGAVQNPGVYTVDAATRVSDLLAAAGGPTADADLERINLAARVHDEEQIDVPRRGQPGAAGPVNPPAVAPASPAPARAGGKTSSGAGGKTSSGPVNINTADATGLATLPGIGPALAGRIIDYRTAHGPFARIEAIQDVSGIGAKLFARIRDLIIVGP